MDEGRKTGTRASVSTSMRRPQAAIALDFVLSTGMRLREIVGHRLHPTLFYYLKPVVADSLSAQAWECTAPSTTALYRQREDLDRVAALQAHLAALDEQLRPACPTDVHDAGGSRASCETARCIPGGFVCTLPDGLEIQGAASWGYCSTGLPGMTLRLPLGEPQHDMREIDH